jgi:hypothetical protein
MKYMIMMFGGLGAAIQNRPPEWITGMHELLMKLDVELRETSELVGMSVSPALYRFRA